MNLFVYGTLLFPKIRESVGGREFLSVPARLDGYQIFRVRDATFPGIVSAAKNCWVEGEVLFDLSAEEMERFDHYEDTFYRRVAVTVKSPGGEVWEASVYEIPAHDADSVLTGEAWTREQFARQHYNDFCAARGIE